MNKEQLRKLAEEKLAELRSKKGRKSKSDLEEIAKFEKFFSPNFIGIDKAGNPILKSITFTSSMKVYLENSLPSKFSDTYGVTSFSIPKWIDLIKNYSGEGAVIDYTLLEKVFYGLYLIENNKKYCTKENVTKLAYSVIELEKFDVYSDFIARIKRTVKTIHRSL